MCEMRTRLLRTSTKAQHPTTTMRIRRGFFCYYYHAPLLIVWSLSAASVTDGFLAPRAIRCHYRRQQEAAAAASTSSSTSLSSILKPGANSPTSSSWESYYGNYNPNSNSQINQTATSAITPAASAPADLDGSKTVNMDHYDIVTVDLEGGRDYPIYIGTGYSDGEGEFGWSLFFL